MDRIKPLFTATATASGGRNGRTESSDGMVKVDLSVPKEMGGPGNANTATPEHLFAAGYAACFGGALDFVVSVGETHAEPLREAAADRRFSRSHQPDEHDRPVADRRGDGSCRAFRVSRHGARGYTDRGARDNGFAARAS